MQPDAKPPEANKPQSKGAWLPILGNGLLVLLFAVAAYSDVEVTGRNAARDSLGLNVLMLALGNFFALLFAVGRSKMHWATGFSISLFLLLLIGAGTCGQR